MCKKRRTQLIYMVSDKIKKFVRFALKVFYRFMHIYKYVPYACVPSAHDDVRVRVRVVQHKTTTTTTTKKADLYVRIVYESRRQQKYKKVKNKMENYMLHHRTIDSLTELNVYTNLCAVAIFKRIHFVCVKDTASITSTRSISVG